MNMRQRGRNEAVTMDMRIDTNIEMLTNPMVAGSGDDLASPLQRTHLQTIHSEDSKSFRSTDSPVSPGDRGNEEVVNPLANAKAEI
jgi:hypothetical protein